MRQDIADLWEWDHLPDPLVTETGKHGDRVETRRLWSSDALKGYSDWPHLGQVCRMERTVIRKGKTSLDVAYAVTSLTPSVADPKRLLAIWRGHWGIENRVHWVRDVTFDEDRCQIRCGSAPQVVAAIRNVVISLLRCAGHSNIAEALRRNAARPTEALALIGVSCLSQPW